MSGWKSISISILPEKRDIPTTCNYRGTCNKCDWMFDSFVHIKLWNIPGNWLQLLNTIILVTSHHPQQCSGRSWWVGVQGQLPPPLFCQKILLKKGKNKAFWKPKFLDLPLQLTCTQPFCNAQVSAAQKYCSVALVYVHIHCFVIAITDDIKDFN